MRRHPPTTPKIPQHNNTNGRDRKPHGPGQPRRLQASGNGAGAEFGLINSTAQEPASLVALPAARNKGANGNGKGPNGKTPHLDNGRDMPLDLAADDGNEHFAKFLTFHRIVPEAEITGALARVLQINSKNDGQGMAGSLLEEITRAGTHEIDGLLSSLIDATKFGYVPLEYYDIDRAVVRMLPNHLTLGRLIVPFDIVSRTMMVALCNPFDAAAKQAVQSSLDYHIQWYLAKPSAITRVLRDVYRLDARD